MQIVANNPRDIASITFEVVQVSPFLTWLLADIIYYISDRSSKNKKDIETHEGVISSVLTNYVHELINYDWSSRRIKRCEKYDHLFLLVLHSIETLKAMYGGICLDIISQYPCVYKSDRLHVAIFWFALFQNGLSSICSSQTIRNFHELHIVSDKNQPIHL